MGTNNLMNNYADTYLVNVFRINKCSTSDNALSFDAAAMFLPLSIPSSGIGGKSCIEISNLLSGEQSGIKISTCCIQYNVPCLTANSQLLLTILVESGKSCAGSLFPPASRKHPSDQQ